MANNITDIRGTPDDDTRTSIDGLCEPIMWGHEGPSATSTRIGSDRIRGFFYDLGINRIESDRIYVFFYNLGITRIGSDRTSAFFGLKYRCDESDRRGIIVSGWSGVHESMIQHESTPLRCSYPHLIMTSEARSAVYSSPLFGTVSAPQQTHSTMTGDVLAAGTRIPVRFCVRYVRGARRIDPETIN